MASKKPNKGKAKSKGKPHDPDRADSLDEIDDDDSLEGTEIIGVTSAQNLRPKTRGLKTANARIVEQALALEPGEVLEIAFGAKESPVHARARIAAVVRRDVRPHSPHHLKCRLTENGTVGIYCTPAKKKQQP